MAKKKITLNAYLIIVLVFLVFTYCLSFTFKPEKENRKAVKTSLINPKYSEQINQIQISTNTSLLVLQKNNSWWEIANLENPQIKLPADSSKINKMINELSGIISVYKSTEKSESDNYGFDANGINLSFSANGNICSELIFGKNDFTQTKRYVKSTANPVVYEMDDFVNSYLSASVQNWSEPYLISQQVLGTIKAQDIQRVVYNNSTFTSSDSSFTEYVSKILELRHGGINPDSFVNNEQTDFIKLELGNKNLISITVYSTAQESNFLLKVEYFANLKNSSEVYFENISSWTLSKLKYK